MSKPGFAKLLAPSLTVFISSACIMIIELVASRLIARHLGSSLYTWTSVIGVVLAGITIGNYIGGRIADKFQARKTLACLFGLASVACVIIIVLNNFVGNWVWLWHLNWPTRVFLHIAIVFLLPSTILGTISPVVAKMALDQGQATGKTVGTIYAWGAAGSIAGTFLAGFYLIATMGTINIIWTISISLLVLAILYWAKFWFFYAWAAVLAFFLFLGFSSNASAQTTGTTLGLREKADPSIIYRDETPYCYVAIHQIDQNPNSRLFYQDKLIHSKVDLENIEDLKYPYEQIHAAITNRFGKGKDKLTTLIIGGGGYVFPRYILSQWPNSIVEVAEIDPGVTKAAYEAYGLPKDTPIKTINVDARNYIDQLCMNAGANRNKYDFIYEDALNDYTVPFQLTTKEFNDKLYTLLKEDGIYLIELIDVYETGLFLSSFANTLTQTFPYVYVVTEAEQPWSIRNTFVIAASKSPLDLSNLHTEYKYRDLDLWVLNDNEFKELLAKNNHFVITDDYGPVENMLAPVVCKSSREILADKYRKEAVRLRNAGEIENSILFFEKMASADVAASIEAYNEIALLYARQGSLDKSITYFLKAIDINEQMTPKGNMANIHFSIGVAYRNLNQVEKSNTHFDLAIAGFKSFLEKRPNSIKNLMLVGDCYASKGQFIEGAAYFKKAVEIDPSILSNQIKLFQSLEFGGHISEAKTLAQDALTYFVKSENSQAVAIIRRYLENINKKMTQSSN